MRGGEGVLNRDPGAKSNQIIIFTRRRADLNWLDLAAMHLLYYYIMSECRGIFGNYFCQFSPFFLLRTLPTHSILLCFLYILGGGGRGGVAVELVDIFKDYFFYLGRGGG